MGTVLEIEREIIEYTEQAEVYLSEEEKTNKILDNINLITKKINLINDCYLNIFPLFDELSQCEVEKEEEYKAIKEIMLELGKFTTKASILFSNLYKVELIKKGCKSALNDLRINIRTTREYLEDIEEKFFLDDDSDIDSILSELQ